jgi:octaprenyl-diphosphate synthase
LINLKKYAEHAGIAFQIKDDIFDYQTKGIIGKPTANDIKEKKITLPLIFALSAATKQEKKNILGLIRKNSNNPKAVQKVIEFVIAKNGVEYAVNKMEEHKQRAIECLAKLPDNEANQALMKLAIYITERSK